MRRLILCADDFGLSSEISHVIADLAASGRVNAVSCMTATAEWVGDSALLRRLPAGVQIGLHLTLSGERSLTLMPKTAPHGQLPSIGRLTALATLRRIDRSEIAGEVRAQIESFIRATGRAPDFIDGHQHSHVLPGIRGIVLAAARRWAPRAWLRDCADTPFAVAARPFPARAIGSAWHSLGMRRAASSHGLRCNNGFAGHYDFESDYAALFPRFLKKPGPLHLVMCHPGAGNLPGDAIAGARIREAEALRNLPIAEIARKHGLRL